MSAAVDFYAESEEAWTDGACGLRLVEPLRGADAESDAHTARGPDSALEAGSSATLAAPSSRRDLQVHGSLRLTTRGRVAIVAAVVTMGLLVLGIAHSSAGSSTPSLGQTPSSVSVQSGDTLWSIAQRVAPSRDPRKVVALLRTRNHLATVQLQPGQILQVG